MRARFALLLVFAVALVGGCKVEQRIVGGTPPPKYIETVISLSPSTTEIAVEFSGNAKLIGRTVSCNYPPFIAQQVPVVMSGTKPNFEKLASLKPDLIVAAAELFSPSDLEKLKQLKLEVFEFKAGSLTDYKDSLYRFGSKVGAERRVSEYVDKVVREQGAASGQPISPTPKVAVLLGGGEYLVAGTRSFIADVVKTSGGQLVGPDSPRFETMNIESLVAQNPDVIVTADNAQAVLNDPRLASVNAIKSKKVARINPDVLLRAGARVDLLIRTMYRFLAQ